MRIVPKAAAIDAASIGRDASGIVAASRPPIYSYWFVRDNFDDAINSLVFSFTLSISYCFAEQAPTFHRILPHCPSSSGKTCFCLEKN